MSPHPLALGLKCFSTKPPLPPTSSLSPQGTVGDRSLFIARGEGAEGFRRNHLIFRRTKGGSVVTENSKGRIAENFGRIQRGDHSNLLGKGRYGGGGGGAGGDRESHQKVLGGITSVK